MEDNKQKMREALVEALNKVNDAYDILSKPCVTLEEVRQACREARGIIIPALSAPPRQCDVGTEEELGMRFNAWCRKHFTPDALGGNCSKCPLKDRRGWSCQLAWSQTPYAAEEGGAE